MDAGFQLGTLQCELGSRLPHLLVLTTVPDDAGVVGSTRGIELLLLDCFAAECVLQQRLDCVREIACKSRGQGARKDL